jgi:hypothetical protein
MNNQGIVVRCLAGARYISLLQSVQTDSGTHTVSYSVVSGASFLEGKGTGA